MFRRVLALVGVLLVVPLTAAPLTQADVPADLTVTDLRVNARTDPLGISGEPPEFSWRIESDGRGVSQTAYELRVATAEGDDVWSTGEVASEEQLDIAYEGPALRSQTGYSWQVRSWDNQGRVSAWSAPGRFETGVLDPDEWAASWISDRETYPGWTDYTIEAEITVTSGAVGLFFRQRAPGFAYMWQFSMAGGTPSLRPHLRQSNYALLDQIPLGDVLGSEGFSVPREVRIEVEGDTIRTYVEDTLVDTRTDAYHSAGFVGFRTSSSESGVVHGIKVYNDEETLLEKDFRAGADNPFTAGTVTQQGLVLERGGNEAIMTTLADSVNGEDRLPLLRTSFDVGAPVERARIYASALGVYELSLNGETVGDHRLAPGWTDYNTRIQYQTYDVTDQLGTGENVLGAMVAPGWYSGQVGSKGKRIYGNDPAIFTQLVVDYADGTRDVIVSDESWRVHEGPLVRSDIIHGETYDAALAQPGWREPGFDDSAWAAATTLPTDATQRLVPQPDEPARVVMERPARSVNEVSPGTYIFDMGQNMVGVSRLEVNGEAGDVVRVRHAEVLDADGNLATVTIRNAAQTDTYALVEDGPVVLEPSFTFHGFRFVEVTGLSQPPDVDAVTGLVISSDLPMTGTFETSDEDLNQLQSNIVWGQRGNFLSIPTDTPARDERMGWTGDINVFSPTATFNMDADAFLAKWLQDLRDGQELLDDGDFPRYVPYVETPSRGSAGWSDAAITVPYAMWRSYGDTEVIRDNFDSMMRYVAFMEDESDDLILAHDRYGDWLNFREPTPGPVIGTAYFAYSTRLLGEMAAAIGRESDAAELADLSERVEAAFVDEFVSDDGSVSGNSQTAYAVAIAMDLLPDDQRQAAGDKLVERIEAAGGHLSTGFLGTPLLLPALSQTGHLDVAYQLLLNKTMPSWLYEIEKGATTLWERWDAILEDGSFNSGGMSMNHYAYGAVGDWMYRTVGGIEPAEAGYRHTVIRPRPGGDLDHARVTYDSPYGTIVSAWRHEDGRLIQDVTVPPNATADVHVPAARASEVTEGGIPAEEAEGVAFAGMEDGAAVYRVGSGTYTFTTDEVLGFISEAKDAVVALDEHLQQLVRDGVLDSGLRDHLLAEADQLAGETDDLATAYAAGDPASATEHTHLALATAAEMVGWVETQVRAGRLPADVAAGVIELVDPVSLALSRVSSLLVGAVATVHVPGEDVLPAATARVEVTLENTGTSTLTSVDADIRAPEGWTVARGDGGGSLRPGKRLVIAFDVGVPADQPAGGVELAGEIRYRLDGGAVVLPLTAELGVRSPLVLESVAAEPASVDPGETSTVTAIVRNEGTAVAPGSVTLRLPDGWDAPPAREIAVDASGEQTVEFTATAPLEGTAGPVDAAVSLDYREATVAELPAVLSLALATPPAGASDHIDLGDPESEEAHALRASPESGTNVEAGLTRRFTRRVAGSYFEFDLAVEPGQAFALRAIETYNGSQRKDYEIYVNGNLIHERDYTRSASGQGTVTFQIVADAGPEGVVTVRFQDDPQGANWDPSIADVWAIPVSG